MLRPNKHSNPDETVLAAATTLLREMRKRRVAKFDDLKLVLEKTTKSSDFLFTPAMSLLYILGLAEYRPTTDTFEYVGR